MERAGREKDKKRNGMKRINRNVLEEMDAIVEEEEIERRNIEFEMAKEGWKRMK